MRYRRGEAGAGRLADGVRTIRGRRGRAPTDAGRRNEDPRGRSCKDAPKRGREPASESADQERKTGERAVQRGRGGGRETEPEKEGQGCREAKEAVERTGVAETVVAGEQKK